MSDFYMGTTEVTQGQWIAVMENNPSIFKGDKLPVENISWYESVEFCKRLLEKTGHKKKCNFRLPTEAEWEFACRAGSQAAYSFGGSVELLADHAWYDLNSSQRTNVVAKKKSNSFGLYDMHGNVSEWCLDGNSHNVNNSDMASGGAIADSLRVFRGGCLFDSAVKCRSAHRWWYDPSKRFGCLGFRLALST